MKKSKKIKVCYVLAYYSTNYVRTTTLVEALKRIDNLILYQARNTSTGIFRYFQTLYKLLIIRFKHNPDYYVLGFRGYEIFWIVRAITLGKSLIFDHMMSPYDSLLNERKRIKKDGLIDKLVFIYEKLILRHSDVILTDTTLHKTCFSTLFQINPDKIHAIYVGTDEDLFKLSVDIPENKKSFFEVFFYGSFQPLHGVDIVLKAASMLKERPIQFTLIGGDKKKLTGFYQMIKQLGLENVTHKKWVDHEKLPGLIQKADLCLGGPFGNTGQARRVITGKTFQFLAMGKPAVVGQIDQNYDFEDRKNCLLVPQGDEKALADAIRWGFDHRDKLASIGQKGRNLYLENFSIRDISQNIQVIFES
ncbi:glycosyltransferase [Chloroflexota bacterium]